MKKHKRHASPSGSANDGACGGAGGTDSESDDSAERPASLLHRPAGGTKTSRFGTTGRISHDASDYYASRLYAGLPHPTEKEDDQELPPELENTIVCGDARHMTAIPDRSVHLMVTSPPYNVTKSYDADLSLQEYLELLEDVFRETFRVLVHGGRACVNVANVGRKPYIPLSDHVSRIMQDIGFLMRGEIIWNKGAGAGVSMAWGSFRSASNPVLRDVHEYILVFSKGDFGREGRNRESSISREDFMEWTKSVWTMPTESARKVGHPAPFPVELPRRLIELYTFKGDVVLDPFMGSGSSAVAAVMNGRRYIGFELQAEYADLCRRRIAAAPATSVTASEGTSGPDDSRAGRPRSAKTN